ncbi:MAG TPA: hypothetical protein VK968_11500 [Roseimicrobium sp.]|nr:hypothetical protein [Roseimicrobium sp.]
MCKACQRFISHAQQSDITAILMLALAATACLWMRRGNIDVSLADEAGYLSAGADWFSGGRPAAPWGPLYSFSYWVLSLVCPDRIGLYQLNQILVNIALPVAGFLYLRSWGASIALSLLSCSLILASSIPDIWPRVSHFSLIILFLSIRMAMKRPSTLRFIVLLGAGFLIAAYARPEFYLSFLATTALAWALIICSGYRKQHRDAAALTECVLLTLAAVVLLAVLGNPLGASGSSDRRFLAFSQHYSLNRVLYSGEARNPWTEAGAIVDERFGDVGSVWGAAKSNPREFIWHLSVNARKLSLAWLRTALFDSHGVLPPQADRLIHRIQILLFAAGCCWLAYELRTGGFARQEWFRRWTLMTTLCCLAIVPSALLVHPRDHYLMPVLWLLLAFVAAASKEVKGGAARTDTLMAGMALGTTAAALLLAGLESPKPRPVAEAIRWLDDQSWNRDLVLMDAEGGAGLLSNRRVTTVYSYERKPAEPFMQFIGRRRINAILVSSRLLQDPAFKSDGAFLEILASPENHGFAIIPTPSPDLRFMVSQAAVR